MTRSVLRCLLVLAMGCDGLAAPVLMGDDGAVPPLPDGGTRPTLIGGPPPATGSLFPASPGSGWESPAACAVDTDGAHCADCWSHSDGGPRSLDRLEAGDAFGQAIAVGDFNGDGYPDLATGAPGEDVGGFVGSGMVFVYLGSERGFQPWLTLTGADLGVGDAAGRGTGHALAAGDFNLDSVDDLAVVFENSGATSSFALAYGAPSGFSTVVVHTLASFDPSNSTESIPLGPLAVADYDDDGYDDLAVGAEFYDLAGVTDAGAVFLINGSATGLSGSSRLDMGAGALASDLFGNALSAFRNAGPDFLAIGIHGRGAVISYEGGPAGGPYTSSSGLPNFGERVAAGDLDNDGLADIVASGQAGSWVEVAGTGVVINSGDVRGSVSLHPLAVVDVDQDGNPDLILRSRAAGTTDDALLAYIGTGTLTPFYALPFAASPRESEDELGAAAAFVDLDGDGYPDLSVGAPASAGGGAGRVHVWIFDPMAKPDPEGILSNAAVDEETALTCDYCAVFPSAADGTPCDLAYSGSDICVFGTCVPRGCGDGFRQTGAVWPREACDDGNALDDDLCSMACVPTPIALPWESRPYGPHYTVGVDGGGAVLVLWETETTDGTEIWAQRLTAIGSPDGFGFTISPTALGFGIDASPSVAGLAGGGWVVAWAQPDGDGDMAGVVFRTVAIDGALGPVQVASEETYLDQTQPSLASYGTGFVMVWTDTSLSLLTPTARRVLAREFDGAGRATTADIVVSTDPDNEQADPVVASNGSTYLVAWVDRTAGLGDPPLSVRARRFDASGALDAADLLVADSFASEVAVATLATGDFVAVWRDGSVDAYGDIHGRRIAAAGPALTEATEIIVSSMGSSRLTAETRPSVAPLTGADYIVVHQLHVNDRGLGVALSSGATAPPELSTLTALLTEGTAGDGAIAASSRYLWSGSSTGSDPTGAGARRVVQFFLLSAN